MSVPGRKRRLASGIAGALALVGCGGGGAKRDGGGEGIDLSGTVYGAGAGGASVDRSAADGGDCAWIPSTASEVAGPPPAQNDSADLRGPPIGGLLFDAGTMRRVVPVAVGATIAGLQIGQAYLSRRDSFDETAYLTIPVTYSGTGHPCFVVASPLRYKNGDQILNDTSDESYVIGAVGDAGFGAYTGSCLNAGDSGYFIDIQIPSTSDIKFFSGTTSLEMTVASSSEGTTPAGRLVPTGYNLGSCGGTRTLRVSAVNDGTEKKTFAALRLPGLSRDISRRDRAARGLDLPRRHRIWERACRRDDHAHGLGGLYGRRLSGALLPAVRSAFDGCRRFARRASRPDFDCRRAGAR